MYLTFSNFEHSKLVIQHPNYLNFLFFLSLIICSLYPLKEKNKIPPTFLNHTQTDQLRGIAILLVIVGHFGMHISQNKPSLILGGEAVAIFFILSGYGLTLSADKNKPTFLNFITRRVNRVLLPYWVASIIIVAGDYIILDKIYSPVNIALTMLGINLNSETTHIDYVRWYITLLLLWYFIFFICSTRLKKETQVPFLFITAIIIVIADYYFLKFGWRQVLAFPVGCMLARIHKKYPNRFMFSTRKCIWLALVLVMLSLIYKISLRDFTVCYLPYISVIFIDQINSIIFSIGLIIFVFFLNKIYFISIFLLFCGKISYELFLFHGFFLIKANPIMNHTYNGIAENLVLFIATLMLILLFSLICNKAIHKISFLMKS